MTMEIKVTSATGTGKTLLSAYDAALINVGINNNLIILSSVIPKDASVVKVDSVKEARGEVGDRLYIVEAEIRSKEEGNAIAAALGWYMLSDGTGTLVEHKVEASSEEEAESKIKSKVKDSVQDICQFRNEEFDESKMGISVAVSSVGDIPACALVVAVFKSEPW